MQCPAVLSNTFLAHRRGSESCAQPGCWWPRRRAKNALHSNTFLAHRRGSESCAQPGCWWPRRRAKNALHYAEGDITGIGPVVGYTMAQTLVQVLKQCNDDLTRENVMRQAANLKDLRLRMMRPGITITTGPTDYAPIKQMQMQRFNGEAWESFGPMINMAGAA